MNKISHTLKHNFFLSLISLITFTLIITSCSPAIKITISETDDVSFSFSSNMTSTTESLIHTLGGTASSTDLFNSEAIKNNFNSIGITVSSVIIAKNSNVIINAGPDNINNIAIDNTNPFTFLKKDNQTILSFIFSPDFFQSLLNTMPEETIMYTELLMAPILTGEQTTSEDYKELISAVYGKTIATEMSNSVLTLNFSVPNNIKNIILPEISGIKSSISNETCSISIPLIEFLSLTTESECRIIF